MFVVLCHALSWQTIARVKACSEHPTKLNLTGSWVEFSCVELSCKSVQSASGALNTLTTQLKK